MPEITITQLKVALKAAAGIPAVAAESLKCSRQNVCQRIANSAELRRFVDEVEQTIVDLAEGVVVDALRKKDRPTARWVLETKGRHRGWVRRSELTGADGAPLPAANVSIQITYVEARKDEEDVL